MYSKAETYQLNKDFWTSFNNYTNYFSKQIGEPIEWMLYKTKIKGLELKFEIEPNLVSIILEINHKNQELRALYYAELVKYRSIIEKGLESKPIWDDSIQLKEGKNVSQIYISTIDYNFHNREHWNSIFQFMVPIMYRLQTNLKEILPILEETLR